MDYQRINTKAELAELCEQIADSKLVGFDTEFVSEDTFRPELCLVQVVTEHGMAIVDPQKVPDMEPFWLALADGDHVTIAHAAREEINFSLNAIGRPPANLFDTQLAAAFCSHEYPAAYASVVTRILNQKAQKGEQRTDWRRRPLTEAQLDYALEDVRYLFELYERIKLKVEKLGRTAWLDEETAAFIEEVTTARTRQRWKRVSGIGNLPPRSLAIVRELWLWRQEEAEKRNIPPRRVLRDDLLVELAKRKSSTPDKIKAVRGMNYRPVKNSIEEIAECVERGLNASLDDLKPPRGRAMPPQLQLLGQVLSPAITSVCRRSSLATSLACTASDIRDLVAYRLGFGNAADGEQPILAKGWRAKLIGSLIDDVLHGRKSIRIEDPNSEHPLDFVDC
ncbi:ribonuclease D [Aeoliella mucimassa]|uniref:Ribonuclease D n=1 Tax=Aeoliella mucimassa TaxID=2527972 RepID=A0A518AN98_9BACT|nr:HRDC domain-containing protein [Aeoliella mucimassa]QDU56171.1 Ribonuclease D [Aeoliella mucimassa]